MLESGVVDRFSGDFSYIDFGRCLLAALIVLSNLNAAVSAELNDSAAPSARSRLRLSDKDAATIGSKVWKNECGGRVDGLTSWNVGEGFPSLGIGHFIWYPENARDRFEESFPKVVSFLKSNGANLPSWLTPETHCPWTSREQFLGDAQGAKMTELRNFLANTVSLQTKYIVRRLEGALPMVLEKAPQSEREKLTARFYRVLNGGYAGAYALIDYVNFKGEGVSDSERYKGQGWGLLQVLEEMQDTDNPVQAFATSAAAVLTRRVKNSPPERHEERWLPGWKNRINTYTSV